MRGNEHKYCKLNNISDVHRNIFNPQLSVESLLLGSKTSFTGKYTRGTGFRDPVDINDTR